jgi:trans-2,3-dihydro-3-hydroxyanthranilate isomerase
MNLDYTLVDVFSDRAFGGNQLAVFTRAEGLRDATMQRLAREFNFSETTFVLPPGKSSHTCRVRIFTPHRELPFAGHPTVGTAVVLARADAAPGGEARRFVLEEAIGPVAVEVEGNYGRLLLQSPSYQLASAPPAIPVLAAALRLRETDIVDRWSAGAGLRFTFVRLATRETVDRASLDPGAWASGLANAWAPDLFVFAGELNDGADLYARCFAPSAGVDEDAATGSACAGLVATLADRSRIDAGTLHLRVVQGVAMGRPSRLDASARIEHGQLAEICVGGSTTILGAGVITLEDP